MDFASGPLRVWSGAGDLEWNGDTFTGVGSYGGVSAVEETKKASANGIELSLSGIPSDLIGRAMTDDYRNRRVWLWLALFGTGGDGQFAMMDDPMQIFGGRMDTMRVSDSGDTSEIVVSCESRLIDMDRPRERRYTDADQKELYPGDRGCEFVAAASEKNIFWGREAK
jgi:hypothetical protein